MDQCSGTSLQLCQRAWQALAVCVRAVACRIGPRQSRSYPPALRCRFTGALLVIVLGASALMSAPPSFAGKTEHANSTGIAEQRALLILRALWLPTRDDAKTLQQDLQVLAGYIAERPQALALLESVAGKALKIRYRKGEFRTKVSATNFRVHAATIYFDPRSAAHFSQQGCLENSATCQASPADTFLHELLHASAALLDSADFLRTVTPASAIYPHRHESEIIARERQLFTAMTAADSRPRPLRSSHAGKLVPARCVTCI
ncbi:MAG: hypothetical protein KJP25_04250 [Gammaproteobacteria bacterium]|nr:hypothetical protein [Gammaproteobacteria bacterium]NND40196.1 hypothetical protein [Pseudomonadales bacterium]MBT8151739.1 hypothetical protein [Gammaproteobacteria bacterium]NNL11288.1 hypothetical protein [Pseudomonadales bacterium]NNM11532.1 hypothetical protein [Pseudomonadales bacterium]